MIRLTHTSGNLAGKTFSSKKSVVRIGSSASCDLRFDAKEEPSVSHHHAMITTEPEGYVLVDTNSIKGTLVNGKKVLKHRLEAGDLIILGHPDGPELRFEGRSVTVERPAADPGEAARGGERSEGNEPSVADLASQAASRIARERARTGGKSSGKTMFIMAQTLQEAQLVAKERSSQRWIKIVAATAMAGLVVASAMGVVIYRQRRLIDQLVQQKTQIDREIQAIQQQMQAETDPDRLEELDRQLELLTGRAQATIKRLGAADQDRARAIEDEGDELDRDIRKLLKQFDAPTYAVPPVFKERLQHHLELLTRDRRSLRAVYARKQKYWPLITKEFSTLRLPEEMAYIAWVESNFDPEAKSYAGARGMWQLMPSRAELLGLTVEKALDERVDVERSTHAAALYLRQLLREFGKDYFMLALASYNCGEGCVRRALRNVSAGDGDEGGFGRETRDFWHLYRQKRLPEQTREYVPKVLAAVIIGSNPERYGLE